MNKLVKITFRDKTSLTLGLEQVEQILSSKDQIIMLYDEEGNWTGQSVNKSEIVGTIRDFYEENRESRKAEPLLIGKPELTPEQRKQMFEKYHPLKTYDDK